MTPLPKVALITGAARRIGGEIAKHLHAAGINVVLHYHTSKTAAEQLCAFLNDQRSHSAVTLQADLADFAQLKPLVRHAAQEWGGLDVLVNNASRFYKTPIAKTTAATWDDLLHSNLRAPYFLSQAAADFLLKRQGCIVNIADVHAERPMQDYSVYCIAKAGVVMLTKALAKELGPVIRVNAVAPGTVMLPEGENELSEELKQKIISKTALRHYGTPEDVAKAVLFLVRDADYVTGEVLAVDGGRSLSM